MSKGLVFFSLIIITLIIFIQTTFLRTINYLPDFSLIVLIYFSLKLGPFYSQPVGFISGFIEDILSVSPPGFNSFIKTIIAFLWGNFKGKMFIDSFLVPIIIISISFIIKALLSSFLLNMFTENFSMTRIFNLKYLYELILSIIFCPLTFFILNQVPYFKNTRGSGF